MRRLVYAVAAVLALAPLAVIAPANAAVQRPAAAATPCDGNMEIRMENGNGSWNVPSSGSNAGKVTNSYKYYVPFCVIAGIGSGWFGLRQYGTSNCATFTPSDNTVQMTGCSAATSTEQNWGFYPNPYYPYPDESDLINDHTDIYHGPDYVLTGNGGDTPVYMSNVQNTELTQQLWTYACLANCPVG